MIIYRQNSYLLFLSQCLTTNYYITYFVFNDTDTQFYAMLIFYSYYFIVTTFFVIVSGQNILCTRIAFLLFFREFMVRIALMKQIMEIRAPLITL